MVFLFVYGIILDRTKAYLKAARLITFAVTISGMAGPLIIPAGNITLTCCWAFFTGSFLLPIFVVALPFTVILTHPIPSDAANGIMLTGSYIFATVGCLGGAPLFEKHWNYGITIFICCSATAFVASLIMKEPEANEESSNKKESVDSEVDLEVDED